MTISPTRERKNDYIQTNDVPAFLAENGITMTHPSFTLTGTVGSIRLKGDSAALSIRTAHGMPQIVHAQAHQLLGINPGDEVTAIAHTSFHPPVGRVWHLDSIHEYAATAA